MNKNHILFALFVFSTFLVKGQTQFRISQYMLHHAFINPAAIANEEKINAAVFHRSQWVGLEGAPQTQGVNFNTPLGSKKQTLGFTVINDRIGVHRNTQMAVTYAYKIQTSKTANLAFGLTSSLGLMQSRFAEANPDIQIDPVFQSNSPVFALPNFQFGTYYYDEKYYAEFALPNLLENQLIFEGSSQGKTSFNSKNLHLYIHGGYNFTISSSIDLNASALIQQVSGAPMQIDINPQVVFEKALGVGISYRTNNEIAAIINMAITPTIRLGYAYDHAFSPIGKYSSGSHEIMLIYSLANSRIPISNNAPRY